MSENDNNGDNDTSSINHRRRRGLLVAIASSLGIGWYLNREAYNDWLVENDPAHKPRNGPAIASDGHPPLTEDEANSSGPHFPWERDTLTITWREGNSSFENVGPYLTAIQDAASFWNDHISENTDETLSLEFHENANDPDIEIVLSAMIEEYQNDDSQYILPSDGVGIIQPYVRVETLTETPDDDALPIRGEISRCNYGINIFQHLAKHLIGRLIGYEIWSEPVDIMTPKRNFGIDSYEHHLTINNVIGSLRQGFDSKGETISESATRTLSWIREDMESNHDEDLPSLFDSLKSDWTDHRDEFETRTRKDFVPPIEQLIEEVPEFNTQLSHYLEAYEEHVASNETAHLTETIDLLDELTTEIENSEMSKDEVQNLAVYEDVIEHFETMSDWPSGEPVDKRIHWHVTDALWSEYNWSEYEST